MTPVRTAVAIPARNEAERIGACLDALYSQTLVCPDDIVLLVNNATDDTAAIARALPRPPSVRLHVIECMLPPDEANAGHARRHAMDEAAALLGPADVLLTTDADGVMDAEGAFTACSFWLVEATALLDGADAARAPMDALLAALGSNSGLLNEQIDPARGSMLGIMPQALSHLALIHAADAIERTRFSHF